MPTIETHSSGRPRFAYSSGPAYFTVITPKRVYRVNSTSETKVRNAFDAVGLSVLAIERDAEVNE